MGRPAPTPHRTVSSPLVLAPGAAIVSRRRFNCKGLLAPIRPGLGATRVLGVGCDEGAGFWVMGIGETSLVPQHPSPITHHLSPIQNEVEQVAALDARRMPGSVPGRERLAHDDRHDLLVAAAMRP